MGRGNIPQSGVFKENLYGRVESLARSDVWYCRQPLPDTINLGTIYCNHCRHQFFFFLNFSTSIIISKKEIFMDLSRPERGRRRRKTLSNNSRSINKYTFFHHCCYITFFFFLLTSNYLYIYTFIHLFYSFT